MSELVASPCVSVCVMDAESGLCRGCYRSLDEITRWSAMRDAEKRKVIVAVGEREKSQKGSDPCG